MLPVQASSLCPSPLVLPLDLHDTLMEYITHLKHPLKMAVGHNNNRLRTIVWVFFTLSLASVIAV
jgi:prephenate dehydrogenase